MSDFEERMITQQFTPEMFHACDIEEPKIKPLLEEKAKQIEDSINAVAWVTQKRGSRNYQLRVIHGMSAEPDVVTQVVKQAQAEIMRGVMGEETYWETPDCS